MDLIKPSIVDARKNAIKGFHSLVGRRFRFEPTPNQLTKKLEQTHIEGELTAAKKLLGLLEEQEDFTREDVMATLHFYIMDTNNYSVRKFGSGEEINGIEHFTDKYLEGQQENFKESLCRPRMLHQ